MMFERIDADDLVLFCTQTSIQDEFNLFVALKSSYYLNRIGIFCIFSCKRSDHDVSASPQLLFHHIRALKVLRHRLRVAFRA